MLLVTPKLDGNRIIAVENGTTWKLRNEVTVKNRPFRDLNGDVLEFYSMEWAKTWCNWRNNIMLTSMI